MEVPATPVRLVVPAVRGLPPKGLVHRIGGKSVKAFLQGRWFGHPLHPLLVHFPTALIPAALLFDILALATGNNTWVKAGTVALLVAVIGAALAVITGAAEYADVPKSAGNVLTIVNLHAGLNLGVLILALFSLLLHWRAGSDARAPVFGFVLDIGAVLLLSISGYLGGKLVYSHGLGNGRDETTGHPYLHGATALPPEITNLPNSTAETARNSRATPGQQYPVSGRQPAAGRRRGADR